MAKALDTRNNEPSWAAINTQITSILTDEELATAATATPTSFYTCDTVMNAIWAFAQKIGFTGGRVLEPGCGQGRFMAAAPGLPIEFTGIEADSTSARIAALLHGDANIIHGRLEETLLPSSSFDLAVGNVPFADITITDRARPWKLSLHNYFLARALEAVRPGGYVAMVTSRYTLDASIEAGRKQLVKLGANLVGAVRLPAGAFREFGTNVVADIVFIQRTVKPDPDPAWVETVDFGFNYYAPQYNRYFADNPGHVLGELKLARGAHHRDEITVEGDLTGLDNIVTSIAATAPPFPVAAAQTAVLPVEAEFDWEGRKEGSYHQIDKDGKSKLYQVQHGHLVTVTQSKELKALIGLRNAVLAVLHAEADVNVTDAQVNVLRMILNAVYDRYVKAFGPVNRATITEGAPDPETGLPSITRRRPAMGGFRRDPDYVTVLAIEEYDDSTGVAVKGPIFSRRVNRRYEPVTSVASIGDAVAVSLDQIGRISPSHIAGLLGIDLAEVPDQLVGLAFLDPDPTAWHPDGNWVPADEYLSGNVVTKLALAREAAGTDTRYAQNVAALEAVQPKPLLASDIKVQLGAPWVPAEYVETFVRETLQPGEEARWGLAEVKHIPEIATWEVVVPDYQRNRPLPSTTHGTKRCDAFRMIELSLNSDTPVIYDTVYNPQTGKDMKVKNKQETILAVEKQQDLARLFSEWVWRDADRSRWLVAEYNRLFNSTVARRFDGSHLTFPGMIDGFTPYQSQVDMVHRSLCSPATLCGHVVGAGKTAIMAMTAVKLRQLGMASKPAVIVPNHLLEQVSREIKGRFPAARVLMATKDDTTKERRKLFAAKVATGDWDVVVMTHSAFTSIPVGIDVERQYLQERVEVYERALLAEESLDDSSRTYKSAQKAVERLRQRIRDLLDKRVDDGVTWEMLGIDYLMVDECFPAHTQILTDRGMLPIGDIVEKGLKVNVASVDPETGDLHWKPVTRWVKKANSSPLVRVHHEHGYFDCTPNHPVWVGDGYQPAEDLEPGDPLRVVLGAVRANDAEAEAATILPGVVRSEVAQQPAHAGATCDHHGESTGSQDRKATAGRLGTDAPVERRPSVPDQSGRRLTFKEGANVVGAAWWERADDSPATPTVESPRPADGVVYSDPASGSYVRVAAELVLRGLSGPNPDASHRSGRPIAPDETVAVLGPAQDRGARSSRVVRVEVLERGSADGHGPSDPGDSFVYNLEVADFHNYIADGIVVGNCHYFKRLHFPTRVQGFGGASKRAEDLDMKLNYIRTRNNGDRWGSLFTGTPVSNTLAELFVLQRYLQPERLTDLGIGFFDAWAASFISFETKIEVDPSGGTFRMHRRPTKFNNVPELRMLFAEVADIKSKQDLSLPGPAVDSETVVIPSSPELKAYVATLVERADKVRKAGRPKKGEDNMLVVCTDGRRAALDMSLIGAPDRDGGKVDVVVERVAAVYHSTKHNEYPELAGDGMSPIRGALQVVFCDMGTPNQDSSQVYGMIRDGLVTAGVPVEMIRFIHHAKTDSQKSVLFADCRAGKVAVLLGSTDKLGVGTNVQHRMVAIHHADPPWRPADVEQRDGRGDRVGNQNDTLTVVRYVRSGSFDAYMWQGLERKARFIQQVLSGDLTVRQVDDVGESVLTYTEVKALASGNPLLMDLAEAQAAETLLMQRFRGHQSAQSSLLAEARQRRSAAEDLDDRGTLWMMVARGRDLTAPFVPSWDAEPIDVDDTDAMVLTLATAGADLMTKAARQGGRASGVLGTLFGFEFRCYASVSSFRSKLEYVAVVGGRELAVFDTDDSWLSTMPRSAVQHRLYDGIRAAVVDAEALADDRFLRAADLRARADESEAHMGEFPLAADLEAAAAKREAIEREMALSFEAQSDPAESGAAATV